MFAVLIIIVALLVALASALRPHPDGDITSHPYNNPYSDATAARDGRSL
jgi:hypothetical protein